MYEEQERQGAWPFIPASSRLPRGRNRGRTRRINAVRVTKLSIHGGENRWIGRNRPPAGRPLAAERNPPAGRPLAAERMQHPVLRPTGTGRGRARARFQNPNASHGVLLSSSTGGGGERCMPCHGDPLSSGSIWCADRRGRQETDLPFPAAACYLSFGWRDRSFGCRNLL